MIRKSVNIGFKYKSLFIPGTNLTVFFINFTFLEKAMSVIWVYRKKEEYSNTDEEHHDMQWNYCHTDAEVRTMNPFCGGGHFLKIFVKIWEKVALIGTENFYFFSQKFPKRFPCDELIFVFLWPYIRFVVVKKVPLTAYYPFMLWNTGTVKQL